MAVNAGSSDEEIAPVYGELVTKIGVFKLELKNFEGRRKFWLLACICVIIYILSGNLEEKSSDLWFTQSRKLSN